MAVSKLCEGVDVKEMLAGQYTSYEHICAARYESPEPGFRDSGIHSHVCVKCEIRQGPTRVCVKCEICEGPLLLHYLNRLLDDLSKTGQSTT